MIDFYRNLYSVTRELTIRAVESMPDEHLQWQPPHGRSVVDIVLHLVQSEYKILGGLSGHQQEPDKALTVANYPTKAALVELLRVRQKNTLQYLDGLDAAALSRVVPSPMGGSRPAEAWLSILVYHEVDHKGNLVVMAKTQGGDPPDIIALEKQADNARA